MFQENSHVNYKNPSSKHEQTKLVSFVCYVISNTKDETPKPQCGGKHKKLEPCSHYIWFQAHMANLKN